MNKAHRTTCCPPAASPPSTGDADAGTADADNALAELAKAVGHPARVRILRFLAARSTCICGDIVDEIGLAQSTVSQHLAVLKAAGLIQGEIDGPRTCYCIDPHGLRRLRLLIAAL